MLVVVTTVGGVSFNNLPMLYNTYTAIKNSQDSNIKEKYINDETADFQNTQKSDSNEEKLSDKSNNDNKISKTTTSANLKKSSDNKSTTKKKTTSSKVKNTKSKVNTQNQTSTNEEVTTSSQSKDANIEKKTNTTTTSKVKTQTIHYDRTTSIYTDDKKTLLRIEYYLNNKLTYYSDIEKYDATTKSYIEKIYKCNHETNIDPLIRTDVYVNGKLTKSY